MILFFQVNVKISYSKCGLCPKDLEVIRPASGIPTFGVWTGSCVPSFVAKMRFTVTKNVSESA